MKNQPKAIMKIFTLATSIFLLSTGVMCSSKKDLQHSYGMEKTNQQYNALFEAYWTGGELEKSYKIAQNHDELMRVYSAYKNFLELPKDDTRKIPMLKLKHKAVFYSFGTLRAGSYTPKGIDKIELRGDVLYVYLKKNTEKFDPTQPQITALSQPWMLFEVPESYTFSKIEIK